MGGIIGMMFSAANPGVIEKLCLNDIGAFIPKEPLVRIAKYVGINPAFTNLEEAEAHLRVIFSRFGIVSHDNWRHITNHSAFLDHDGHFRLSYDPKIAGIFKEGSEENIASVDLSEIWQKVTFNKCLILRGIESDILLPDTLAYMVNSKPGITAIEFSATGHAPALMEENQLRPVVKWFIE